jgi:deoxyribose-phosphate aldolase
MTWTREKVAATIDHAVLKPSLTDQDIVQGCQLGKKYQVASVCVRPSDVAAASRELAGSGVKVSMVVGFPHGANRVLS